MCIRDRYQELEVTVNPEGYTRKTSYNESGQPVRITDENGERCV